MRQAGEIIGKVREGVTGGKSRSGKAEEAMMRQDGMIEPAARFCLVLLLPAAGKVRDAVACRHDGLDRMMNER